MEGQTCISWTAGMWFYTRTATNGLGSIFLFPKLPGKLVGGQGSKHLKSHAPRIDFYTFGGIFGVGVVENYTVYACLAHLYFRTPGKVSYSRHAGMDHVIF